MKRVAIFKGKTKDESVCIKILTAPNDNELNLQLQEYVYQFYLEHGYDDELYFYRCSERQEIGSSYLR